MANDENLIPAKKGEIRNPKGRTEGSLNLKTIMKKILETKLTRTDPLILEPKQQRIYDSIVKTHIAKAMGKDGEPDTADLKAIDMVYDRMEGKSIQTNVEKPYDLNEALRELDEPTKDKE